MRYLTEAHRIDILIMIGCGDRMRTHSEVVHLFHERYPHLPPISQSTVSKIERQFRELRHVKPLPRQFSKVPEETKLNILLTVQEAGLTEDKISARRVAREHNISHTTVLRIFDTEKMYPYKMEMVQELSEGDPDRRVEFCERMMNRLDSNEIALENVLFSDESIFQLHGEVNRHNCRYWAAENPHWIRETHTQYPQKVNVWAGIIGNRVVGPKFFDGALTSDIYLEFLRDELIPSLAVLYPNEVDADIPANTVWFQQDGAPPHYGRHVREYLDEVFPMRWIGRRGTLEWPPRSPDLTPMDFFLWGYIKNKVYVTRPQDIEELKERIRTEIRRVPHEMLTNVRRHFYERLGHCQVMNGQHFEHLL